MIEKQNIITLNKPLTAPFLDPSQSEFSAFFHNLNQEEQNYESFFNFKKEQLCEIIRCYYEDLQKSFQLKDQHITQFILSFLYEELYENLNFNLVFEGTGIGVKEENFSLSIEKEEPTELAEKEPAKPHVSVIKITQNSGEQNTLTNKNIENAENQKFAKYIEQTDKISECVNLLRKKIIDPEGKIIIQLAAMIFILFDILDNSQHKNHKYELQINGGKLKLQLQQECLKFDLANQFILSSKFKN